CRSARANRGDPMTQPHPGERLAQVVGGFVAALSRGGDAVVPIDELTDIVAQAMRMTGENRYDCATALADEFCLRVSLRHVVDGLRERLDECLHLGANALN